MVAEFNSSTLYLGQLMITRAHTINVANMQILTKVSTSPYRKKINLTQNNQTFQWDKWWHGGAQWSWGVWKPGNATSSLQGRLEPVLSETQIYPLPQCAADHFVSHQSLTMEIKGTFKLRSNNDDEHDAIRATTESICRQSCKPTSQ